MQIHIAISYIDDIPEQLFDDFTSSVSNERLGLIMEARPSPGPMAGVEWLLTTAVIVFIARPYFEGFLKEAGSDHYKLMKRSLGRLMQKLSGIKIASVGSKGKLNQETSYSLAQSVVCEFDSRLRFKLLVPECANGEELEVAAGKFIDFMKGLHEGHVDPEAAQAISDTPVMSGTLLLTYNSANGKIEPVNPLPKR